MPEVHPAELQRRKGEAGKIFRELKEAAKDCKKTIQLSDQILKLLPGDEDAIAWRVQSLLQFSRFGDCVKFLKDIEKSTGELKCPLHLAYSYYRLANEGGNGAAQLAKAEETLKSAPEGPARDHILAQVLFKKAQMTDDDFSEAAKQYAKIARGRSNDVPEEDVLTNAAAAATCARDFEAAEKFLKSPPDGPTPELLYNKVCVHVANAQWESARQAVRAAETAVRTAWEEDGAGEDKDGILDELATVRVQRAYINAVAPKQGEDGRKLAVEELLDVVRRKPSSKATAAVASNNLAALQHDVSHFDAFKRLKPLTEAHFDSKLSQQQRGTVRFNRALLNVHMGNLDQLRTDIERLQKIGAEGLSALASAAALCDEKKFGRAEDVLRSAIERTPKSDSVTHGKLRMTLAQIHLLQGNSRAAAASLSEVSHLAHQPGSVATTVSLYETAGEVESASACLDNAIAHWREQRSEGSEEAVEYLPVLLQAAGEFRLRHRLWKAASENFKELARLSGSRVDPLCTAGMVLSMARLDPAAAEEYADELPADLHPASLSPEEAVEMLSVKVKSGTGLAEGALKRKGDAQKGGEKKKRRRRGKPAGATGEPDPERWMKRKDRPSYQALPKRQRRFERVQKNVERIQRLRRQASEREENRELRKAAVEKLRAERQG